jgi:hypothetical protein
MSEEPIPRLPAHIAALIELEKDAYPEEMAMKGAVYAGVAKAVILAAPLPTPGNAPGASSALAKAGLGAGAASKGATLGKLFAVGLAAFAAGGLTGGLVVQRSFDATAARERTSNPATIPVASAAPAPLPQSEAPPLVSVGDLPLAPNAPRPPSSAAQATANATPSESNGDLSRERELIEVARAALARGSAEDAIAATKKHESRWPHGSMAEEREVVLIQALVAAGRKADAEERAAKFRQAFPQSMFLPAIAAALDPGSPSP